MDLKVKENPKQKMLQIVLRQKILITQMQGMTALRMIVRLRALMIKLMSLRKKLMKLTVLIQIVIITLQKPIALLLL